MCTLVQLDESLFWLINGHNGPVLDRVFRLITQLGNAWVIGPALILALYLVFRNRGFKQVLMAGITAMLISGLFNAALKQLIQRPRPLKHFKKTAVHRVADIHVVGKRLTRRAFPSGHTNTAFSAAVLVVILFGSGWWPVFILAGLTGYSRIYLGVHFPADVIAGAVTGTAVTAAVLHLFMRTGKLPLERK